MQTEFVMAVCDVYVKWEQGNPPRYRCYVNDELFTERTWIWRENYLEEQLQILAEPGRYQIRYELVDTENAKLTADNYRITLGPASVDQQGNILIQESQYENA
jgi:hypothetical protein